MSSQERALRFDREHARQLRALAYRMLGSRAEAEDVVQDAWIRWADIDESKVQHAGAFLSRMVTNLCLDQLRASATRREQYVGVWLPEPMLDEDSGWAPSPESQAEFAQDVSMAFMLALQRLSPLERAAFLLRDVFDVDFDDIAHRLDRSPEACRQLVSRARQHVKADYARCELQADEQSRLLDAFNDAVRSLNVDALAKALTADAVMLADGGGRVSAVPRPLQGGSLIAKALIGFAKLPDSRAWELRAVRLNGMAACLVVNAANGELVQAITLTPSATEPGRIGAIYIQRNPEKLGHIAARFGLNTAP